MGLALLLNAALSTHISAQPAYERPTTLIVPVGLTPNLARAVGLVCAARCTKTRWADRTFSEGLAASMPGDTTLLGKGAGTELLKRLSDAAVPGNFILRQFLADKDFGWRYDSLLVRSEYAVSVSEAQKMVRDVSGPNVDAFRTIPSSYIIAISASDESMKAGKGLMGGATWDATAKLWVAVYKLGYKSTEDVFAALSDYFCAPDCPDKDARRAKFMAYRPPLEFITSFTVGVAGTSEQSAGQAKAWESVGDGVLDELIGEMASRIPKFAVRERLIAVGPAAARIGMKEGVTRGGRYYHYEMRDSAGTAVPHRSAVLMVKQVADNRKSALTRGAVTATVAAVDSTTFSQVFPGSVHRGDMIVEKPTELSWAISAAMLDGRIGALIEPRYEGLGGLRVPPAFKALLSGKIFGAQVDGDYYRIVSGGAGVGYELFPLHGRLRVMPIVVYDFYGSVRGVSTSVTSQERTFSAVEAGVDLGVRLTPELEAEFSARRFGFATIANDGTAQAASAPLLSFGLRLQRGRWGF